MTQIDITLYQQIAEDYAIVWGTLQVVDDAATLAVTHVVDITTATYPPGPAAALEIELALLTPLNDAATGMTTLSVTTAVLLDAVRAVNSHVINNTTGTGNAKTKLDTWVNVTMTPWHSGVPNGWEALSSDAGYDTSDWNINPSIEIHSH